MTSAGDAPQSPSPRALLLTVLGLYVRELGGWISVGRLIELMGCVSVEGQAVRSLVARLKKNGFLVSEKRDGAAGYALSEYGRSVLAEGDRRIFSREEHHDSDWVIAVFSVPESERERRHALRSRLSWLGFATIASGTWVAPAHAAEAAQEVLERDGLDRYVELFHADHLGFGDLRALVGQWWDLDGIQARYEEFINAYEPLMARWQRPPATEERQAVFADYVRLLTSWRQLPYLDPGLPAALLPAGWKSVAAAQLFTRLQAVLEGPARQYAMQPG